MRHILGILALLFALGSLPALGEEDSPLELILLHTFPSPNPAPWYFNNSQFVFFRYLDSDPLLSIEFWDYEENVSLGVIDTPLYRRHNDSVWSPNGRYFVVVGDSGGILIIDTQVTPVQAIQSLPIKANILHVDWGSSGVLSVVIETGPGKSDILHFDVANPQNIQLIHRQTLFDKLVIDLRWSPSGTMFATASYPAESGIQLEIWNGETYDIITPMEDHRLGSLAFNTIRWSKDSDAIYGISGFGSFDRTVWIWPLEGSPVQISPQFDSGIFWHFQLSYNEEYYLFVASSDKIGSVKTSEFLIDLVEFTGSEDIFARWHPTKPLIAIDDGEHVRIYEVVE